jgi:hypothetical protein
MGIFILKLLVSQSTTQDDTETRSFQEVKSHL